MKKSNWHYFWEGFFSVFTGQNPYEEDIRKIRNRTDEEALKEDLKHINSFIPKLWRYPDIRKTGPK